MFPSSSRVKLNRVALTDVIGLQEVPRRRRVQKSLRNVTGDPKQPEDSQLVSEVVSVKDTASVPSSNEPVQTFLTDPVGPEKVTGTAGNTPEGEPEENCVGTQKAKRNNVQSHKGIDTFKPQGPYTRGKYQQSKPNTRTRSRLDRLRKLCNLRLRLTWCFYTASDRFSALLKWTKVHRRVKLRGETPKMFCQIEPSSEAPVDTNKSQTPSDVKFSVGKPSGRRCKSTLGDIKHKSRVSHVAKGGRDRGREGESRVKAGSTGWDPQPAAANTGQVRPIPTGLSSKVLFSCVVCLRLVC